MSLIPRLALTLTVLVSTSLATAAAAAAKPYPVPDDPPALVDVVSSSPSGIPVWLVVAIAVIAALGAAVAAFLAGTRSARSRPVDPSHTDKVPAASTA